MSKNKLDKDNLIKTNQWHSITGQCLYIDDKGEFYIEVLDEEEEGTGEYVKAFNENGHWV